MAPRGLSGRRGLASTGEHALARPLARARVGVSALPVDRQTAAMTETPVAPQVHETLDVHLDLAAQIALDLVVGLENFADLADLVLGKLLGHLVRSDAGLRADVPRGGLANPVQVREREHDVLVAGEVDTCDAGHGLLLSALTLLVTGVLTDDPDD